MEAKFKIGDQVKVINYGHRFWEYNGQSYGWIDMSPELIGKTGVIKEVSSRSLSGPRFIYEYSISGIPGKTAWYNENQLEKL